MSDKLTRRADDFAQELVKQFLIKQRTKGFKKSFKSSNELFFILDEWDQISEITKPDMTVVKNDDQEFKKGEHYIYTPMHGWATQEAFKQGMKSAFDFLDEDEMTFHENQNIETPVETVHFIKKSTSSYFISFYHKSDFFQTKFHLFLS